ncbi:integrase [Sporosarcina sp. 179-K 3D1 HS]|uniref:integrase n=1 Tax=Sporosarcina sp. 179-K 3D1 HS TaxID=3232169 RepID=UPI00399F0C2C
MNNRIKMKRIKQWMRSTADAVRMDTVLKRQQTGVNMSYDFIQDMVGYDLERLPKARREMKQPVSLEAYVRTLTMHELGHAVDREALLASFDRTVEIFKMKKTYSAAEQRRDLGTFTMLIEEHEMNIAFEETAWDNAEKMNRLHGIVDWNDFYNVKAHSLSTYQACYERDLRLYQRLLAANSTPVAV